MSTSSDISTRSLIGRNIRLYYWYEALSEPLFWGPILIFFIQSVSLMSLSQIYFMESVCVLLVMVLQIPTGTLADLIGRRKTIVLGQGLLLVELLIFASATTPLMIWLANLLWAAGFSLISGAEDAWLFDSLKILGREKEFKKIKGKAIGNRLMLAAVACLATGYLAEINLRLPVYLSLLPLLICFFVVYNFVETPTLQQHENRFAEVMKAGLLFVANHRALKWIIGFSVTLQVVSKIWFFTYNPYFELVKLPLRYYGIIFFLLNVCAALSSWSADWIYNKIGQRASVIVLILLIGLPLLVMGSYVAPVMVLLVLLQNIFRGYQTPFTDHFFQDHLNSQTRATAGSVKAAALGLAQVLGLGIFSVVLKVFSLPTALQLLGTTTLLLGLLLIISYHRIFPKQRT